jgi:hypothetical protein
MMKGICIAAFGIVALAGCSSLERQQAVTAPGATTATPVTDARATRTDAVSPGWDYNRSILSADPYSDYPDLPQTPF